MRTSRLVLSLAGAALSALMAGPTHAATLPEHDPLSIVVVSDQVNPNGLPDAELTQPGDLSTAIGGPESGIVVGELDEVASDCIDDALVALDAGVDVLVYFAHLPATSCAGADAQGMLTDAIRGHLEAGGGVVVFHHGVFTMPGKEGLLGLLGSTAGAIDWQPDAGQTVIATGGDHFVVTNGLDYPEMRTLQGNDRFGIAPGDYPAFTNVPDERYPGLSYLTEPGEERRTLFVSDYGAGALLGYDLRRADWAGHVVMYQPGEYQPNALDPDGANFQILANAIYYVGTTQDEPGGDGGDETEGDGGEDGADDTGGDPSSDDAGDDPDDGDDGDDDDDDGPGGDEGGTSEAGETGGSGDASAGEDTSGCSCMAGGRGSSFGFALIALGLMGCRRRRGAPHAAELATSSGTRV